MKLKKLTALLSTVAIMLTTVSPISADEKTLKEKVIEKATVLGILNSGKYELVADGDFAGAIKPVKAVEVPTDIAVRQTGKTDYTQVESVYMSDKNKREFDFKATMYMETVEEAYESYMELVKYMTADTSVMTQEQLDNLGVKGKFTIKVIYPESGYFVDDSGVETETNMSGFENVDEATKLVNGVFCENSDVSRNLKDGVLTITVDLKEGLTVKDLAATEGEGIITAFKDIVFGYGGIDVTKAGTYDIEGTVEGYISINDGDDSIAYIPFKAVQAGAEDEVYGDVSESGKIQGRVKVSTSSPGGLGGGGSTTTKKKATVTFYNGTEKHLEETVDITKGAYTFDVGAVAVPEAEKNKVFTGWYEDKECTIKADAKESITKDTDFYAGWADTKYKIEYKIDGVDAPVNTGMTGSVVIDNNDVVVNEDDSTTVNLSEIKAVGVQIVGWYLDPEHKIPADPSETVNTDTIFYAVTKPIVVPPILEKDDHFAYIIGYPEGDVRPENSITREEVATIFFRLLTEETRVANMGKSETFADVEMSRWSNNAISTMSKLGIVNGYEDGTFGPAKAITRAEFATIAARFEEEVAVGSENFTDIADHWAEEYIKEAAALQWVNGYEDGSFKPQKYITRAEVMTIVNRMLQRSVSSEYILEDAVFWSDNADTAWYYEAVMEATNSHEYERLAEGLIEERWTAMKANRDWSELEK